MVRGGGQLLSWLKAFGSHCEKLQSSGSKVASSDIQLLTKSLRSTVVEDKGTLFSRQESSSASAAGFFEGRKSSIGDAQIGLGSSSFESLRGSSARFCTIAESDLASPPSVVPVERSITYYASARHPGSPGPRLRNDRLFRAGHNLIVAEMVRLLESASSNDEVEKILNDRMAELTEAKRWPWLPLLDALQRGPKPCLALEVFNWKKDKFDGAPKEYAKMISTAGRLSQLDMATTLFIEMEAKGVKRTPIACNALISAYSKNDKTAQAMALFKEMQGSDDCKPTLVTYNTLISMFSKLSVKDMETYFSALREAGFFPDTVTYNSMIWGYMRIGLFDKMEELYEELVKAGCKPDPITFSALIMGFSKAGLLQKMDSAFSSMQEQGYPITSMIAETMVEFYGAERQFESMERIMKIVSNTPGVWCNSRICGFAIQAYAETGRIEQMEQTVDKLFATRKFFTTSKVLEAVITAHTEKSNFEGLEKFLTRVKAVGWSFQHSTFHALIYEYGRSRQFDKMEDIFGEMKRSTDVLLQPTAETYQLVSDSYNAGGDEGMLVRTVDEMRAAGFDPRPVIEKEVDRAWTDAEIFDGKRR